jgi:hypothetical protein
MFRTATNATGDLAAAAILSPDDVSEDVDAPEVGAPLEPVP